MASCGEVATAAAAGFTPERLFHSNPIKKDTDIAICARHGVQWFTFDNADEIAKLCAYAPGANVLLRVAIKNESCVVNLGAKFGVNPEDALPLLLQARSAGINVRGSRSTSAVSPLIPRPIRRHSKIVRQIFDDAAAAGVRLDTLDIGGGFPVTCPDGRAEARGLLPRGLAPPVEMFPAGVRIIAEPGRCISGDAMTLVVRVIGRSIRNGIPW